MRSWESVGRQDSWGASDSQDRMDQVAMIADNDEETVNSLSPVVR